MKYTLNKSLRCYLSQEGLMLHVADSDVLIIDEGKDIVIRALELFKEGLDNDDIYKELIRDHYISTNDYNELFELLKINNIIKEINKLNHNLTEYHLDKYNRQIISFHSLSGVENNQALKMQEDIVKAKIILLGVGGIGSHLALALASIGVEELIIIDMDKVELSNTSRQILYDETDVGKYKIDVAEEKLKKYNRNIKISKYNIEINKIDEFNFLQKHLDANLLVLCADTPRGEIQYLVDEYAHRVNLPWLYFGPFHHSQIALGPFIIPNKTKSYREIFPDNIFFKDDKIDKINSNFHAAICDPFNGIAAQMAAIEILKYLTNYKPVSIYNKRIVLNTDIWDFEIGDFND